jgi:hypothetical protein
LAPILALDDANASSILENPRGVLDSRPAYQEIMKIHENKLFLWTFYIFISQPTCGYEYVLRKKVDKKGLFHFDISMFLESLSR